MTPAACLPIEEGDRVLDLCAAPAERPRSWRRSFAERVFW